MTYAGFKSYIHAGLSRDDPRVHAARRWIRHHYTLAQNPGMPEALKMQGYYYYLMTFARALSAWGSERITSADGQVHDWAAELTDTLTSAQRADGSWCNDADRWMEGDANLVTAYALIALNNTVGAQENN
jgi:squalene-hopene/tetraprenyl-beta-curcumene cyclase